MPTVATNIETVCTDQHLANEVGGMNALDELTSDSQRRRDARKQALADALDNLRNRTPPVYEASLTDITELTRGVTHGALAILYRAKITIGNADDGAFNMSRMHQKLFESTISALRPTVADGQVAAPWGIALHRR